MRVAEAEHHLVALLGHAVAHTDQLEMLREAGVDAGHHVGDQAAHEAVQRAVLVVVGGAFENQLAVGLLDADLSREGALELALRPFDLDAARTHCHLDLVGHRERQLSNPRQLFPSIS